MCVVVVYGDDVCMCVVVVHVCVCCVCLSYVSWSIVVRWLGKLGRLGDCITGLYLIQIVKLTQTHRSIINKKTY